MSQQTFDFNALTVPKLKDQLRALKLPLGGNKPELVYRLQVAYGQVAAPAAAAPQLPTQAQVPLPVTVPTQQLPPVPGVPAVPVQAGLPVVVTKPTKPKVTKSPTDTLKSAVRDADQTLDIALAALLDVYGATDHYPVVINGLVGLAGNKPVHLPVPQNADALRAMKVADLKRILKERGDKVGGKKEELIHRVLNPTPKQGQTQVTLPPPQVPAPTVPLPEAPQVPPPTVPLPGPHGIVLPNADDDEEEEVTVEEDEVVTGPPALPIALPMVPPTVTSPTATLPMVPPTVTSPLPMVPPVLPTVTSPTATLPMVHPVLPTVTSPTATIPMVPTTTSPKVASPITLPMVPGVLPTTSPILPTTLPTVGSPTM